MKKSTIAKWLVIPLIAGTLIGCKSDMKVKKDFHRGGGILEGRIGHTVRIGKYRPYDKDSEVLYRRVGEREWVEEEGFWKKHTDKPFPLGWIVKSSKKVSDKEVPIYVQDLYELWMDNDPGENSALAIFALTKRHMSSDGTPGYRAKQPNKQELEYLNKQADKWIEKAREYFK